MHKFNTESYKLQEGHDLGYYGIFLSRRVVPAGESLNIMAAIYNKNPFPVTRVVRLFAQQADVDEAPWLVAVEQETHFPPREGKHVYFTIQAEDMARLQGKSTRIRPAEYVVFCGENPPDKERQDKKRCGVSDLFCIVGEANCRKPIGSVGLKL